MFEVAFDGQLGSSPRARTSEAGKAYKSLRVAVRQGDGSTEWVGVAAFNNVAKELPANLGKGERVYVEGQATLRRTPHNTNLSVEWQGSLSSRTVLAVGVVAAGAMPRKTTPSKVSSARPRQRWRRTNLRTGQFRSNCRPIHSGPCL
jgi:single-stranded DNA-binding protein